MTSSLNARPVTANRATTSTENHELQTRDGNSTTAPTRTAPTAPPALANLGRRTSTAASQPPRAALPNTTDLEAGTTNPRPPLSQRFGRAMAGMGNGVHESVIQPTQQAVGHALGQIGETATQAKAAIGHQASVAGTFISTNASHLATQTVHHARNALADSLSNLPSLNTLGAAAGHTMQQIITCGGPTFAREEVFMQAYHALMTGLAEKHPVAMVGMQAAVSCSLIAAQVYVRHPRMDRLGADSSVAVRGHFGMSEAKWAALPPAEQAAKRKQQATDSRNVTRNQVAAEAVFLMLGAMGAAKGDGAMAARIFSTQLRNLVYAGSRETLQASVAFTGKTGADGTHGVNEGDMETMGWTYTAMTLAMGFLQDALIKQALPAGHNVAGPAITDAQGKALQGKPLQDAIAVVAGMRALCNTAVEFMDAHMGKHFDTRQAGMAQKFQDTLKNMFPMKDYGRLLDHSVARLSWNNSANAGTLALQQMASAMGKGSVPAGLAAFATNVGTAAGFGLSYRTVNQTYQAHSKVRAGVASAQANPAPADTAAATTTQRQDRAGQARQRVTGGGAEEV